MHRTMARLAPALLLPALVAGCVTSPATMHESFLTLDTHLDTPTFFGIEGWNFGDRHDYAVDGTQIDLPRMIEGGLDGGFFVTFTPQGPLTDEGRAAARTAAHKRLDEIQAMFARYPGRIQIVRTAAEGASRIAARADTLPF